MPSYRECKECRKPFIVDMHCLWHQRGTCGRDCDEKRAAKAKVKRQAAKQRQEVSDPLGFAVRKAEIDLRHTPNGVYPDAETPEAERQAREKCGADVPTMTGVGNVRQFSRSIFRKSKKPSE